MVKGASIAIISMIIGGFIAVQVQNWHLSQMRAMYIEGAKAVNKN